VEPIVIRDYDPSRDGAALPACFIELQNHERRFDAGMPEGSTTPSGSTTTPPAGAGFVDPAPREDSEFTTPGDQGEQDRKR